MRTYQQLKNMYHFLQAHFWRFVYWYPDRNLRIFGVTGTNGKTTTCYILASIFSESLGNHKVGMLTTISMRVGERTEVNETKLTTLPSRIVYRYLKQMKRAGVTHAVMEITSHALDQHRLGGIKLDGAIVTHIEREHLNYHRTMEEYVAAKAKIANYLLPDTPLVVKQDNEWTKKLVEMSHISAKQVTWFTAAEANNVSVALPGAVNKENALAAMKLAQAIGIKEEAIQRGLHTVQGVPGRMEEVANNRGLRIIIDYAVTPQALEKLYKDVRAKTSGKVLAILGAAGLRDRGKRADMARIVADHADMLVITREDPWTESEEQIFTDLEAGLDPNKKEISWWRIVDRKEALTFLLQQAQPGDAVIATGKGAETGMGIGKRIVPYNEGRTIEEILKNL